MALNRFSLGRAFPIFASLLLLGLIMVGPGYAVDYRLEPLNEAPPAEVSAEVAGALAPTGVRVVRGENTKFCDVWLTKAWQVPADFKATNEVLYPFQPGQLIGVVRYYRSATDFREQKLKSGLYLLRYGQQPVDGAHVGTSPTRDFLLVVKATAEDKVEPLDMKTLNRVSSEATESLHPGILSMQRLQAEAYPSLRHNEDHDWWVVGVNGTGNGKPLPIEFVIVGISPEI
jgi:hypothetical protein